MDSFTAPLEPLPWSPVEALLEALVEAEPTALPRWSLPKKSHQTLSTLSGSFW